MSKKFQPNKGIATEIEKRLKYYFDKMAKAEAPVDTAMDSAIVKWGFWKQAQLAK